MFEAVVHEPFWTTFGWPFRGQTGSGEGLHLDGIRASGSRSSNTPAKSWLVTRSGRERRVKGVSRRGFFLIEKKEGRDGGRMEAA